MGLPLLAGLLCFFAYLSSAHAKPGEGHRPWAKGTLAPSVGGGFAYSSDVLVPSVGAGLGFLAFDGLSCGLSFDGNVLVYSRGRKGRFSNLSDQVPTNVVRVLPTVQWVFLRRPRLSPYVSASLGPAVLNNGHGVFGSWMAAPGVLIGLAGPVYLDLGMGFSGFIPRNRCNKAFAYTPSGGSGASTQVVDYCTFRWGLRLNVVLAFGGAG